MSEYLTISNTNAMIRFAAESMVYVVAYGNYSDIYTCDGKSHTVTLQLGEIEDLIDEQLHLTGEDFMRIGKSLIVNTCYVTYIHPTNRQMVLSDNHTFKYNLEASKEALRNLKEYLEKKKNK